MQELPKAELDNLLSGGFYINLHLITGRKPDGQRMGDREEDGTRAFMTEAKYDWMARSLVDTKSTKWKRSETYRIDLDIKLEGLLGNFSPLHGGLEYLGPPLKPTGTTPKIVSPVLSPIGRRTPKGSVSGRI